jgi:hypothetical protein
MRKRLRYADLHASGVVNNRVTLSNWIRDLGFPAGQLTGPNTRTWGEDEVDAWVRSRPIGPKAIPPVKKGRRGRPRKSEAGAGSAPEGA